MVAEQTTEIQNFPTLWTGTITGASWGIPGLYHPDRHLMGESPQWHEFVELPFSMKVLRQTGRNLELRYITEHYEDFGVGTLSADGRAMVMACAIASSYYTIDGDRMTGLRTARNVHESGETHFSTAAIEMRASA